jgi:hypothetical protein
MIDFTDKRHAKFEIGSSVKTLSDRRRYTDSTFTDLDTLPAGTVGVVEDVSNAGFDGLLYHLRLPDGTRLPNVPAGELAVVIATVADLMRRVDEIIASHFPPGTLPDEVRRDPDEDGFFVMLDDPTNEFEYVQIYINADGTWEA